MGKKGLQKSLRIYLSKLKKVPSHLHLPDHPRPSPAAATSWLLSACKYPKTPSFALDRGRPDDDDDPAGATLSDVDRFLHENFHSLYSREAEAEAEADDGFSLSSDDPAPPAAFVRSSGRFFVSPGTSNSLLDEAQPSTTAASTSSSPSCSSRESDEAPGGGVAVMTFSKDPYDDFRRSMEGMVEARHAEPGQPLDWDFMEELLFCYLELNDRSVHKHILRAFTDLTVSFRRRARLRPPAESNKESRRTRSRRRGKVGEEGRVAAAPRPSPAAG